jgi:hypothetical protein
MGSIAFLTPAGGSSFDPAKPGPIGATTPSTINATRLTVAQGTLTNPLSGIDLTATWNDAADTMRGLEITITDTASAAGSTPLRIMGGAAGTSQLAQFTKLGVLSFPANMGVVTTPSGVPGIGNWFGGLGIFGAAGLICTTSGLNLNFGNTSAVSWGGNAFLFGPSAATFQCGANHPTTPTLQTIQAHNVTLGTGADLCLKGGTGSAANGMVMIGTHSAVGAETVTGYIQIKDEAGNVRKLAVLS